MQDKTSTQTEAPAPEQSCAPSSGGSAEQHLQQTLAHQRETVEKLKRKRLNLAVARFLGGWVFALLVLVVIGMMSNLEWARPKIQESMSNSFHRQVRLGNLSWVLGLNGLAMSTDKLEMLENDGKPFIVAGQSEIGVAFLPLFSKRVLVKHIDFHAPEVYATQIAPGRWNFSDLVVEGPEIRFVQVDDGRLHLRNALTAEQLRKPHPDSMFANMNWASYDFQKVNLKLIFPRRKQLRPWPFYLAFQLPRDIAGKKYQTDFSLTVLGNGQFNEWKGKNCDIDFRADNFNPADWRPFMRIPAGFNGLLSVQFKGHGVPEKAVTGDIKYSATDLTVENGAQSLFTAQKLDGSAKASIGSGALTWDKAVILIGGVKLESRGEIFNWQSPSARYDAKVAADLRNLAQLSQTSLWHYFPGATNDKDLSGAAIVEVSFEGEGDKHRVFTSLKAEDIPLANLLASGDSARGASLLSLFQIEPNVPVKGKIEIGHDQRILLEDVEIPAKGSSVKINGFIDAQKKTHEVSLTAKGLALDKFDAGALGGSKQFAAEHLALTGVVDFDAKLVSLNGRENIDVKAHLAKASLTSAGKALATDLVGDVHFDGTTVTFNSVQGVLANGGVHGGTLVLKGSMQTSRSGTCSLDVSGHHVNIAQLVGFARAAHLPLPGSAVDNIAGNARDLTISITGRAAAPALALNASPEDVRYAVKLPQGEVREVRAVSGNITLLNNVLQLHDVLVNTGVSKLLVNASFENTNKGVVPRLLHLKTAQLDVAEFLKYTKSETLPADVRRNLAGMVGPLYLQDIAGKAACDVTIRVADKGPNYIEGNVVLSAISGKFGEQAIAFDSLNGTLVFAGDDVSIRDMTCNVGQSALTVTGSVKSFQETPTWNVVFNGDARGSDVARFVPSQVAKGGVEISSRGPISLHGEFSGDNHGITGNFLISSPVGEQFKVKSNAASFQQVVGRSMNVDGSLSMTSAANLRTLDLRSWHAAFGDASIQGSGKFMWSTDASMKPSVDFIVSTPNAVPADVMVGAFLPGIDASGATGTMKGTFAAVGDSGELLTHGELTFSKVTIPSLRVKDMDGKLDSPRWLIASARNRPDNIASEAQLSVAHANFGNVDTSDLQATLKLESGPDGQVTLHDGTGTIDGGKTNLNGWYSPTVGKWRLDIAFEKMLVDRFLHDLIDQSGQLTGLADGKISLSSTADGDVVSNLAGGGHIVVYGATVPRLGQLHEKLQAANILQQGIFGFNINNVMHSILPSKTGKFKEIAMDFAVDKGVMNIDRLNFDGNDLRLRAAGAWNLMKDTLDLEVAGDIPRVASSVLPGMEVTRNFTLQKAVRIMTFRKLENFPNLPIIGDIGTDDPRAFTFKIAAALDSSDAVSKSIEKSFKWLPNRPNASAHPVLGMN